MDGLELDAIDRLDCDIFDGSPEPGDEDSAEDLPMPDCIGLDSAVQDDEQERLEHIKALENRQKTRAQTERELEFKLLNPNSIRSQILSRSLQDGTGKNNEGQSSHNQAEQQPGSSVEKSHVMNIVEKAGMQGIDKEKINEIIHEASKGSLFYRRQAQRQEEIHKSIEKMLNKVKIATPQQVTSARSTCDRLIKEIEKQRVFNRIIVHFDLDMFFAAVEIRDNPSLADKPMAVGGDSMVSTSNYIARRYGVRAAMPGFIARKLCPELLLIKPDGAKYRKASTEVFAILERYDPELAGMSLDEAYLDLTDYVKGTLERDGCEIEEYYDGTLPKIWWTRANEVVQEIRDAIHQETKLTCSAGIACNTLLAKISTDIKKPDGQFMVEGDEESVLTFIRDTPVGKVSGIGKVSGQFLSALGIKTCGDLYEKRHFLPLVFYEINVRFYLRVALGDGSTCIKSDENRKSKSVERTFSPIKDTLMLLDKLDSICDQLCNRYLKPYRIRGRTITVKLKRNTFHTTTRSYSMLVSTNDKSVIYSAAKNLLLAEIADESPEISYRLLGVKLSNLADDSVTSNQMTIDALLRIQELSKPARKTELALEPESCVSSDMDEVIDLDDNMPKPVEENDDRMASKSADVINSSDTNMDADYFTPESSKSDHDSFDNSNSKLVDSTSMEVVISDKESLMQRSSPDEVLEQEQRQSVSNEEAFQCPYCFKPFDNFNNLESHVERCYLKTPIDVNKSFFSQRVERPVATVEPTRLASSQKSRIKRLNESSQASRAKKPKDLKEKPILAFVTPKPRPHSEDPTPSIDEPNKKMSFYQRFMESNSQKLAASPKSEPLQCPYCLHGFLDFNLLEKHVMICNKKG